MPNVRIETNKGSFEIALDEQRAPKSVANFLAYVDAQQYDGTIFHRVIPNFMAQGGGFDGAYSKRSTNSPVQNEADNGLKNRRGTVAMARTSDPHSATSQFFVNVADNDFLDHRSKSPEGWGYTVFGTVVSGMETIDAIVAERTGSGGPFAKDAPLQQVVIHSARRL
ncbi:peptidylprolyl isomerase [Pendulispora brunnea]|uniref:Peptidyl-prolyl cis-trans isomerase n=1 Tax=Pendulispora brunnea TaxID=2905690 RepID=A0ABZ2KAF3_9BACT